MYLSSGKENVKVERLREPDKTKYEIYNVLNNLVPKCKNWNQLLSEMKKQGIDAKFKYKGQTDEIQGITFTKKGYSFTDSKVDRNFSYSKIDYQLNQNNQSRILVIVQINKINLKELSNQLLMLYLESEVFNLMIMIMKKKPSKTGWKMKNKSASLKTNSERNYKLKI